MRIGNSLPPVSSYASNQARYIAQAQHGHRQAQPGIIVDISQAGWEAYAKYKAENGKIKSVAASSPIECKTCASRKYQDVSNDSTVSFQTPTHISPGQSAAAVASHESEHVSNEQANAEKEGREIISQTVTLKTAICPECKRVYVSGGETRTVSREST